MRELKDYSQVHAALASYMLPRPVGETYTLARVLLLMEYLGNPQDNIKIIHIAGTSGKTSTSYYCAALLTAAGFTTGLTVSPHIDEVNERAQINLRGLNEKEYCLELSLFLDIVDQSTIVPSYFELLVAFAYWLFDKKKVDYAVVEVGLGGLLDATNVIHRADKICLITDIGLDHTEVLGKTLPEIATQKAGIIQPHTTVFMHPQPDEIQTTISLVAKTQDAHLTIVDKTPDILLTSVFFNDLPDFQKRNVSLAYAATDMITQSRLSSEALDQALQTTIPARMELIEWRGKLLILDGSHNVQKLTVLVEAITKQYSKLSKVVLTSFGENKAGQLAENVALLGSISRTLYITTFKHNQDQPRLAIDPATIASYAKDSLFDSVVIEIDPEEALDKILNRSEKMIVVTGSFYLLSSIRSIVMPTNNR